MHSHGTSPAHGLDGERQAADSLLQLLRQEQAALVDGDVERMSTLTDDKAKSASRMAQLAKSRHELLASAGFAPTEAGMQEWLTSVHATAADKTAWDALLAVAANANELNRINGLLIGQHMARNQVALNILQGNADSGGIYGPNGQSANKIGGRRLVVG